MGNDNGIMDESIGVMVTKGVVEFASSSAPNKLQSNHMLMNGAVIPCIHQFMSGHIKGIYQ